MPSDILLSEGSNNSYGSQRDPALDIGSRSNLFMQRKFILKWTFKVQMFHWIYICSSGLYQKAFHNGKTIIKIQYIWESAIKSALQKHPQINPGSLGLWYLRTSTLICFRQLGLSPSARVMCSYSIWWDMALPTHWAFRGNLLIPSPGSGERRKFCKDLGLLEDKLGRGQS